MALKVKTEDMKIEITSNLKGEQVLSNTIQLNYSFEDLPNNNPVMIDFNNQSATQSGLNVLHHLKDGERKLPFPELSPDKNTITLNNETNFIAQFQQRGV